MAKIIFEFLLLFLAAIGITEVIRFIILFFVNVKSKDEYSYIIIPMRGKCEDAECRIRASAARVRWSDSAGASSVICLDCGLDDETREICEKTACDYNFVVVMTKDEFFTNPVISGEK